MCCWKPSGMTFSCPSQSLSKLVGTCPFGFLAKCRCESNTKGQWLSDAILLVRLQSNSPESACCPGICHSSNLHAPGYHCSPHPSPTGEAPVAACPHKRIRSVMSVLDTIRMASTESSIGLEVHRSGVIAGCGGWHAPAQSFPEQT